MTEDEFRAIVRTNIKRYRACRKWTQAEFAEKLGISINFLSDIENGKRWISPTNMVKFASVLNIEPFELFKPADTLPSTVSTLLTKYDNEVMQAVSESLKQIHSYYQAQAEAKPKSKKPIRKTKNSKK